VIRNPDTIPITPSELDLLALYASGHQLAEIGAMKFLSPHTVRNNLVRARKRVGAKNLTHLCVMAVEAGIIRKNGNGFKPVHEYGIVGE
jgi:DNA-binding CsgD family transcriptional regulator